DTIADGHGTFWMLGPQDHALIECLTGLDLVKLQFHIARGGRLPVEMPPRRGCAIQVMLHVEDQTPRRIERLRFPNGPGIRVDPGAAEGDVDSDLAKITAYGHTEAESIARLRRALRETVAIVHGATTN